MKLLTLLAFLLLAGAPAAAQAPDAAPPSRGALDFLLEERDELGLSAAQAEEVRGIRARLHARNRPLVERLLEIRRRWQAERPRGWQRFSPRERRLARERFQSDVEDEVRALRAAILRHHRDAVLEARDLLTPEQRVRARTLLRDAGDGPARGSP